MAKSPDGRDLRALPARIESEMAGAAPAGSRDKKALHLPGAVFRLFEASRSVQPAW